MRIFMPCKTGKEILRAAQEALTRRGHSCTLYPFSTAEKMRIALEKGNYDIALSTEAQVLCKIKDTAVRKVYLAPNLFCGEKLGRTDCALYLIPHEELSFDFINAGAREKKVQLCGIPLPSQYLQCRPKVQACRSLGLCADRKTFTLFADGVSGNEIKSTVRAAQRLCPETQILVMAGDAGRRKMWQSAFADLQNVFVLEPDVALGMSVGDAVFLPAVTSLLCTAARLEKVCILLHVPTLRCRRNAAFADAHGMAFSGKTAADNVSYAQRLLDGERLRQMMFRAQEKNICPQPEQTLIKALEALGENEKKH